MPRQGHTSRAELYCSLATLCTTNEWQTRAGTRPRSGEPEELESKERLAVQALP